MKKEIVIITLIVMALICLYPPTRTTALDYKSRAFLFNVPNYEEVNFGQLAIELVVAGLIGFGVAYAVGKKGKK